MRTPLRLALSAMLTGVLGLSPAVAQTKDAPAEEKPKLSDDQRKEVEAKLNQLLKQIEQYEAKKAEAKKAAQPEPVKPAKPDAPGLQFQIVPSAQAADPVMGLKMLLMKSSDPKVIALSRELLALLEKPATPKPGAGDPFKAEVGPAPAKPKPGQPLEFKFGGLMLDGQKVTPQPEQGKGGIILMTAPAPAASTLKLSADGKTAAVVGADGSITIYDVATGKEQLKFPSKK